MSDSTYQASIEAWRQDREKRLRADEGWLTLAGLFWLKEGANTFGTGPDSDIKLPEGSSPAQAGSFEFHGGRTTVKAAPGMQMTVNKVPLKQPTELKADQPGVTADVVRFKRIAMMVLKRGERYGIRVKDSESKIRREFKGLDWFPVKESYLVKAKWVPSPRTFKIVSILGDIEEQQSPGYAVFRLNGKELRLAPVLEEPDDKQLFFIFKDQTSGKETYPAVRFLYAGLPQNGKIVLDFNKAYNPPCAFNPYSTCPLPPKENVLATRIEAGEKYHKH